MDAPIIKLTDGCYASYEIIWFADRNGYGEIGLDGSIQPFYNKKVVHGRYVKSFKFPEEFHGAFVMTTFLDWRNWSLDGHALEGLFNNILELTGKRCSVPNWYYARDDSEFAGKKIAYSFAIEGTHISFDIAETRGIVDMYILPVHIGDNMFDENLFNRCCSEAIHLMKSLGFE